MDHFSAITLKQLRALSTVIFYRNQATAAQVLHVTPPAVSTQLRSLEANVGAKLLGRDKDGRIVPTAQGEEILATAKRIESALADCRQQLKALASGRTGVVKLGVVSTAKYFAPKLVAVARRELPGVEIALKIGNRERILAALADGEVNLAIMGRPPGPHLAQAEPLGPHPHLLIAAPDHPLAHAPSVSADALLSETFLMREPGSGTRMLAERYLDKIGQGRPIDWVEFGTNETIKQGVMAGLGVALISGHTVVAELETGRLARLAGPDLPIMREWYLVKPHASAPSNVADRLASFMIESKEVYLPRVSDG